MEDMEDDYAIGLDLGTTFSCIGVYRNGGVEIIPNSYGEKITPSVVVFLGKDKDNKDRIIVGEETSNFLVGQSKNCIYEVKRLIGFDYNNEKNKDEIKNIKKLPFNVKKSKNGTPMIELEVNNEKIEKSPLEISSLIIGKMVEHAENYLHKKIKKLVITVPAYFEDQQKKITEQAATALGLKVIKIIPEPTAAALAYGFNKENIKDEKILVFDLGGGTFDISILSFESEKDKDKDGKEIEIKNLKVLAIDGDMHLGGEDFDNALVDYVINKQNKEVQNEIEKDPQKRKKLKVACENIKKVLSDIEETSLIISQFCKIKDEHEKETDFDLMLKIKRKDFEDVCDTLFQKMKSPLKNALSKAKITKDNISEVILIGGSTRIPKVKEFIREFFGEKININDSINPDETVAYGATLQAEKLLYNQDQKISNFHILNITPFSLGISTQNNSEDEELKKEGLEMSVIIPRGATIPTFNKQIYETVADNQTKVSLKIYEGEKKYVKYNHLLKETLITGLSPKPKGQTNIEVEFKIDVNGILTVKAEEISEKDGKNISLTIKNDEISLSPEEMEKLKIKMEETMKKTRNNNINQKIDYTNLFEALKTYEDNYNQCEEDETEDKLLYLANYQETLEEFIDAFDQKFDNETMLEKYYLYIKRLFLSYLNTFKIPVDKSVKEGIFNKIKKYLQIFFKKSTGYLNNLLDILSPLQKCQTMNEFYDLIIFVIKNLNNKGIELINSSTEFCKYKSLIFFEQSLHYCEKYIPNEGKLKRDKLNELKKEKKIFNDYIDNIKSGAIIFTEESLLENRLFDEGDFKFVSKKTGLTNNMNKYGLVNKLSYQEILENTKVILEEYEKLLAKIQKSNDDNIREAKCIANILKLNNILGLIESKKSHFFSLAERCKLIIDHLKLDTDKELWCKEFLEIYNFIKSKQTPDEEYAQLFERVKKANPGIFEQLDEQFNKNRGTIKFIEYILKNYPYKTYKKDLETKKEKFFKTYNNGLITHLSRRYIPEGRMVGNAESEKKYCIIHEIASYINNLMTTLQ